MQSVTDVPIIHMIRESVRYAVSHYANVKKIGIMGTDGTIDSGIYEIECERAGVVPVHPSKEKRLAATLLFWHVRSFQCINSFTVCRIFALMRWMYLSANLLCALTVLIYPDRRKI